MAQSERGLSIADRRVERLAKRYAANPLNYRLLKRLWLTPNREHGFERLAVALDATVPEVRQAIQRLEDDGLVVQREDSDGRRVYCASSSLSAHGLITRLLAKDAELDAIRRTAPEGR